MMNTDLSTTTSLTRKERRRRSTAAPQRALERLRALLRAHPEVAERTRDYLAGDLDAKDQELSTDG